MSVHPPGAPQEPHLPAFHSTKQADDALKQFSGVSISGQTCYIDMGVLYGNNVITQCMNWGTSPATIDSAKASKMLENIFSLLKQEGVNQVNLAFGQISDISNLAQGSGSMSPNDTIATMISGTSAYNMDNPLGENFLKFFSDTAKQNNTAIDLSFGGANASAADMTIPGDATTAANTLTKFMDSYGINSVDFDIEGGAQVKGDSNTFFTQLHSNLHNEKKQSTLTVEGGYNDPNVLNNFSAKFDGVNLMLYSQSQYYLDTNYPSWGIEQWIKKGIDPSQIHIGFYPAVNYASPGASGSGQTYPITPGSSSGQAAAQIYQGLCAQLQKDGYTTPLGQPFVWEDSPPGTAPASDQFMQDFYNSLNGISRTPWS